MLWITHLGAYLLLNSKTRSKMTKQKAENAIIHKVLLKILFMRGKAYIYCLLKGTSVLSRLVLCLYEWCIIPLIHGILQLQDLFNCGKK